MKRKSQWLFLIITVSMIAVVYSQGVWLYNSYLVRSSKERSEITNAWMETVGVYAKQKNDSIAKVIIKRLAPYYKATSTFSRDTVDIKITGRGPKDFNETVATRSFKEGNVVIRLCSAAISQGLTHFDFGLVSRITHERSTPDMTRVIDSINRASILAAEKRSAAQAARKDQSHQERLGEVIDEFNARLQAYRLAKDLPWETDSMALSTLFKKSLEKRGLNRNFYILHEVHGGQSFHYDRIPYSQWHGSGSTYLPLSTLNRYFQDDNQYWVEAIIESNLTIVLNRMLQMMVSSSLLTLIIIISFIYLVKTILRQKRLAEMKDDFINNMTHELKTPIATIAVAIEGMQKFNALQNKEKTERYLETSRIELNKLNNLITKVLNIAAYEKKDLGLDLEKVEVTGLLDAVISNEQLREVKPVNFKVDNQFGDGTILVDKLHFTNSLANLVDNAVKYSGENVDIQISCYTSRDRVYLSIKDNGIGIPAHHLSRIFDKFYRVPKGNVHAVKGTGLGLSYVKHVVNMHGGDINVKSEPGKGSEFTLWIPLKPVA